MEFEYQEYYSHLVTTPIVRFVVAFASIILIIFLVYRSVKYNNLNKWRILFYLSITILAPFQLMRLFYLEANFHIIEDKDEIPIQLTGVIADIDDAKVLSRYYYDGNVVRPNIITINDQEFYIATSGGFIEGDNVEIMYLPNSKVILVIGHADD